MSGLDVIVELDFGIIGHLELMKPLLEVNQADLCKSLLWRFLTRTQPSFLCLAAWKLWQNLPLKGFSMQGDQV